MTYNLDQQTEKESFEFILGGHKYKMVYPTTEEIQEIAKIEDAEAQGKEWLKFISSGEKDAPPVQKALEKKRVTVYKAFNAMIKTEFGLEG